MILSDTEFLSQFENLCLDEKHFDHKGHLRLAWIYLSENDLEVAIEFVCTGIKSYAESLGANKKFHLTITDATVRIISKRIALMEHKNWESFLQQNQDLVDDLIAVLEQHFSQQLLFSELARTHLVPPDLKPF